ncbi:unnamed protein product [Spodoptera exigua]|nr:unnamed protein product [Spodoptera exigua]
MNWDAFFCKITMLSSEERMCEGTIKLQPPQETFQATGFVQQSTGTMSAVFHEGHCEDVVLKMKYFFIVYILTVVYRVEAGHFDRYSGKKVEVAQAKELRLKNATERCSIEVKPCTPHEGSRVDGTCNNYKYPTRGSAKGPYLRLLKPDYANDRHIRMNRHNKPLPSARKVRTELHTTGRVEDKFTFNVAAVHMMEFIHRDISAMDGPWEKDPRCIPIHVPHHDPYLKVTDIHCLNFSRAETFQDAGCTPEIILPEQSTHLKEIVKKAVCNKYPLS